MTSLFPSEVPVSFARVAVERGIDRHPEGLTYGVPQDLAGLEPGERVVVPLGRGDTATAGYVIEVGRPADLDPTTVKLIARRDRAAIRLPAGLVDLARWISSYYCTPIGLTLAGMLPAAVKRNVGSVTRTLVERAPVPDDTGADEPAAKTRLSPQQRAALEALDGLHERERPVEMRTLADLAGLRTTAPIKRLVERGLLAAVRRTAIEAAWTAHAVDAFTPEALTPAQRTVVDAVLVTLGRGFSAHLLHGVTGSGKTEVYIRLIAETLSADRTALVLVPEISLTPQTAGRILGRFPGHRVAILHSGLTAAQRHQQWALAADGTADIVIGARSAVFAPVPDGRLGLVIVDEEHDGSYKQDQAPRYHGRDVAVRRAQLADCPVVLGSATPSLESWHNATRRGTYRLHRLQERVTGMQMPRVHIVDFAEERRKRKDRHVHLIGPTLELAIERTLDADAQVLLLLNRRGYANYIACPDQRCGWVMTCDFCDVTTVYHRDRSLPTGGFVQCHHCQAEMRLPASCPDCGRRVTTFGLGTQRVEEELVRRYPQLDGGRRLCRVDADSMRSARDFHDVLARFGAGELRMLVGTQMIAKGLDFPGVRLVGVVNADTAIHLPDFRAAERTFQLVSQVAGRSGRSVDPSVMGRVVVQTFNPDAPAIRLAAAHDYETFAENELAARERCGLPPFTRLARIVLRHADHERCVAAATATADGLRRLAGEEIRVRGPAPCPISRIAGRHRQQVELLAPDAATMQRLLTAARNAGVLHSGALMAVDVDAVELL